MDWYLINQLPSLQPMTLVKCCGVVLHVTKQQLFVSLIISDSTSFIEATIYQEAKVYKQLKIPSIGDSIIAAGLISKKPFGENNKQFTKIKLKHFSIIAVEKQLKIMQTIIERCSVRGWKQKQQDAQITRKKRPKIKELQAAIEPIEIRSLILCSVYLTLENNPDLNSYTFSAYSVRNHRLAKSFLESKKLKQECLDYLEEFIVPEIKYLLHSRIIEQKPEIEGRNIYKINKKFFTEMEMRILGLINEHRDKEGISALILVHLLNKEFGFVSEKNYAFTQNLIHKILLKFIEEGKIYKNSNKILFPNF